MNDKQACNICGGNEFLTGPKGRLSKTGAHPRCACCGSLERHRLLRSIWNQIPPDFLRRCSALQFSADLSVEGNWFKTYEISIYGHKNSLDIQAINRPSRSYDVIICNHVLEHVPDDIAAIKELSRILKDDGLLQITVPNPYYVKKTNDWGYPDPNNHEHYRTYGEDFQAKFSSAIPDCMMFRTVAQDPVTSLKDFAYFWTRSPAIISSLGDWFPN